MKIELPKKKNNPKAGQRKKCHWMSGTQKTTMVSKMGDLNAILSAITLSVWWSN